jgi:hypothetical protein
VALELGMEGDLPPGSIGAARTSYVRTRRDERVHGTRSSPDRCKVHSELDDGDRRPSRWNTLRALRVLGWYEQSPT